MPTEHGAQMTRDHEQIRRWVEARGGKPARVEGTGGKDDPGLLRIDFPEAEPDTNLHPISWDEFFEKFDEKNLVFLYQDETASGGKSRFFKLINEETAAERADKGRSSPGRREEGRRR